MHASSIVYLILKVWLILKLLSNQNYSPKLHSLAVLKECNKKFTTNYPHTSEKYSIYIDDLAGSI